MAWLRYVQAEGGTYIQLGAVRRDDDLLRGGIFVGRYGLYRRRRRPGVLDVGE